jgi:hypothetical protein
LLDQIFYPSLTLPDALGRELIFPVSPQSIGGIKGGNLTCSHNPTRLTIFPLMLGYAFGTLCEHFVQQPTKIKLIFLSIREAVEPQLQDNIH